MKKYLEDLSKQRPGMLTDLSWAKEALIGLPWYIKKRNGKADHAHH